MGSVDSRYGAARKLHRPYLKSKNPYPEASGSVPDRKCLRTADQINRTWNQNVIG
jgi:hypothetical protein